MATWTKASGYYTLKLEVTETGTSTANNTSTLKWVLTLLTGSTYFSSVRVGYTVKIDGTTVGSLNYTNATSKSMAKNDSWEMASGTTTVTHNADGTKTIATGNITAVLNTQTGNIVPNISLASTSALTLTTIPRASTVTSSAASTLMGTVRAITITRASSSFTHTLKYTFGSASGTIATGVATSYSWTVPTSLAAQVASGSIRASGTIICETYSGSTKVGEATTSFIAQIPPSTATTSASDNTMGKARSFTISRASSALTHTLTYVFGSGSGTITTKTTSMSVSWTVPTSLAAYVAANNASGSGTVTITTFNGSAEVGTSTVSFTAKIPASTMTKANCTMGKSTSFTITRAGTNLTHKITYAFGNTSGTAVATADGTTLSWTPPYSLAGQLAITSGTKSGTITYTLTTYNGTASCGTNTYTATLSAPSASLTVPSSFTMGTAKNITIAEQDAAFTHTITGTFEGTTATFATKTTATSVSTTWATATFGPLIPTAKSGTGTVKHTAYSGNTVVAYNEYTTTVSVPSTAPTATITTSVVTSLASPFNTVYIQNNSQVKVAVALSSPTGAYLDKATMTIDGVTKSYSVSANVTSWSGNVTSNLLQTSGTRTITVKVTDKRGYTGTYTTTISVTAYSNPSISNATGETKVIIERSNSSGTADPAGSYLHLKFIREISAITNNTGYVSYKVGSGTATTISTSTTASVTINQTLNLGWSEHNTYQVTVRVWDSVGKEVTRTVTIPSLNVTLDLRAGGTGIGIGMFSQADGELDINPSWHIPRGRIFGLGLLEQIPQNADLNSPAYRIPGRYSVPSNSLAASLSNFPSTTAGTLTVYASSGYLYADPENQKYAYLIQEYRTLTGNTSYQRHIFSGETAGAWNFGSWSKTWDNAYNPNAVQTATLSYESTMSSATKALYVQKSGHVVTVNGYVQGMPSQPANTTDVIATIPTGYRSTAFPIRARCGVGSQAYNTTTSGYLIIGETGTLAVYSPIAFTAFNVSCSYIIP
ncbi:MAG: hypothetical protein IKG25_02290 [Mogibacterium sp.]|nr:hypothetical protein [Mogibacterium sp.]